MWVSGFAILLPETLETNTQHMRNAGFPEMNENMRRYGYRIIKGGASPPFWCQRFWHSTLFMRDTTLPDFTDKSIFFFACWGEEGPVQKIAKKHGVVWCRTGSCIGTYFSCHATGFQMRFHRAVLSVTQSLSLFRCCINKHSDGTQMCFCVAWCCFDIFR